MGSPIGSRSERPADPCRSRRHDDRSARRTALWIRESETLGPRARPDVLHLVDVVTELDPEELLDRSSFTHRISSLATRGAPGSAIDDKYDRITWVLARHDRLIPSYDTRRATE
jgi:hypothetical protein